MKVSSQSDGRCVFLYGTDRQIDIDFYISDGQMDRGNENPTQHLPWWLRKTTKSPKSGWPAPGFEPGTSRMRVSCVTMEPPRSVNFFFCLSIVHASSFYISTSQILPVVFAHSVVASKPLQHTTLHSTQRTSLAPSLVLLQGSAENSSLPVKSFFGRCFPLLYFLTAVHVATDITSQAFEVVNLQFF